MAWIVLQKPGSKAGPCHDPCGHKDCTETRRDAEAPCAVCGKPIGFERPFLVAEGKPRHWVCALRASYGKDRQS